jgi:hypothetical protein
VLVKRDAWTSPEDDDETPKVTMIDWNDCPDVERIPGKVSGA